MEKINFEQFIERVKKQESISRFDFELDFIWTLGLSKKLKEVLSDLSEVDLRGVDLRGVDLIGVDLRGVDLRWANLSGANLSGADLSGADLRRVNGVFTFSFGVKLEVIKNG